MLECVPRKSTDFADDVEKGDGKEEIVELKTRHHFPKKLGFYTCRTGTSGFYIGPWLRRKVERVTVECRMARGGQDSSVLASTLHSQDSPEEPEEPWDPVESSVKGPGATGDPGLWSHSLFLYVKYKMV